MRGGGGAGGGGEETTAEGAVGRVEAAAAGRGGREAELCLFASSRSSADPRRAARSCAVALRAARLAPPSSSPLSA